MSLLQGLGHILGSHVNDLGGLNVGIDLNRRFVTPGESHAQELHIHGPDHKVTVGQNNGVDLSIAQREINEVTEVTHIKVPQEDLQDLLDKLKGLESEVNRLLQGSSNHIEVTATKPKKLSNHVHKDFHDTKSGKDITSSANNGAGTIHTMVSAEPPEQDVSRDEVVEGK